MGGSLRNAKPQKNGEKQQGGVGGSLEPGTESWGWAVRNLGWGESGRGCGKQLVWPSSQWGDGARLVSSPESRGPARGRQASPSSPPAPPAGWSAARERQAEPSKQPGSGGERTQSTTCQGHVSRAWHSGWLAGGPQTWPGVNSHWDGDSLGQITRLPSQNCLLVHLT